MGSSPVPFKIFLLFFDLLVSLSLFLILCTNLFEFGMGLCNKYRTVNIFNKPSSYAPGLHVFNPLHAEYFLRFLISSARSDF